MFASLSGYKLTVGMTFCWIMEEVHMPPALEAIFDEIERGYASGFHYLTMAVALTIPDICAGAELDLSRDNVRRAHYENWCRRYLSDQFSLLDEVDIYNLRGGMIHTGQFSHRHQRYDRPFFTVPGTPLRMHDSVMSNMGAGRQSALSLDLEAFVGAMRTAVVRWWADKRNDEQVKSNVERIIRYRPNGIPPFVVGAPVVG